MAGISNARFCLKLIPYGFNMVTLGGYNADKPTVKAAKKIMERGRLEFDFSADELPIIIQKEVSLIKDRTDVMVSVNLRAVTPDPIIEISRINEVDVVEINAHCRQGELTSIGCGQALLMDLERLEDFTREVVRRSDSKVSVKIRGNIPGVDEVEVAKVLDDSGVDYIHLDAMKPGFDCADFKLVNGVSKVIENATLIGNNSIRDLESARRMLKAGADGISIARAAINGKLSFNLSLL
ncbi:MAG: tRNA-dihydrouridine synthase [Methanothermobacter sp.]|nr:tRNA-dihydrouridine synthase [Methanothermobacter sp.]